MKKDQPTVVAPSEDDPSATAIAPAAPLPWPAIAVGTAAFLLLPRFMKRTLVAIAAPLVLKRVHERWMR